MNIKQLFFVSLIVLSVAMGLNWFKNRPKTIKKQPQKVRQAISLSDLELKEENEIETKEGDEIEEGSEEDKKIKETEESDTEENQEEEGEENDGERDYTSTVSNSTETLASQTTDLTASSPIETENPLKEDIIMSEYFKITRNPFEVSPYAKLVEKKRIEAEMATIAIKEEKEEVVLPVLLNAKFSGTIETGRGLRAIIETNLYQKGDEFNGNKITEIKSNLVIMKKDSTVYLLPKVGVQIDIDKETGKYRLTDSYD